MRVFAARDRVFSMSMLLVVLVACDWEPVVPGAEVLGELPVGTPKEEVYEALGAGPLAEGEAGWSVEHGYRTSSYFVAGESWQLVWVVEPDFTPADSTSAAAQTPVLFREGRLEGWGWEFLREAGPERGIPVPAWAGGAAAGGATAQRQFWNLLGRQCGAAYAGRIAWPREGGPDLTGAEVLQLHFRSCSPDELQLALHLEMVPRDGPIPAEWDRSNSWILRAADDDARLELRHDRRHRDGSEIEGSWYGGFTDSEGTATEQEFVYLDVDDELRRGWRIVIDPGVRLTYGTVLEGDWTWRAEFDLSQPLPEPPPPWGYEDDRGPFR